MTLITENWIRADIISFWYNFKPVLSLLEPYGEGDVDIHLGLPTPNRLTHMHPIIQSLDYASHWERERALSLSINNSTYKQMFHQAWLQCILQGWLFLYLAYLLILWSFNCQELYSLSMMIIVLHTISATAVCMQKSEPVYPVRGGCQLLFIFGDKFNHKTLHRLGKFSLLYLIY